jgi:hypothetical protein
LRRRIILQLCAGGLAATLATAHAQDMEPRAYSNAPIGMSFLVAGVGYMNGSVLTDPAVALENAEIEAQLAFVAYAHVLDVWGRSGKVDIVLPAACLSGSAEFQGDPVSRDVCGAADPMVRVSYNIFGAPSLSLPEFASYAQDLILGASVRVGMPFGQYDPDRLVNIGTNRWSFKPEIGVAKALDPLILEFAAGVALFTDNDDFFGGKKRQQDPIYSVRAHGIYRFRSGIWAALDATGYRGGRSTVNGVQGNDLQENVRFGATLALPVGRSHSVKCYATTGAVTRIGGDFDTVNLAWQYRWGGRR